MASSFIDSRLEILKGIEDGLLDNTSSFRGDNAASLYEIVKKLKTSVWQINDLLNEGVPAARLKRDQLDDLLRKVARIGARPSSQPIFDAIAREALEFADAVYAVSKSAHTEITESESDRRIADLETQLKEYETLVSDMKEKAIIVNTTASRLDNTADKLATKVEGIATEEWTDEYLRYISPDERFRNKFRNLSGKIDKRLGKDGKNKWLWHIVKLCAPIYRAYQVVFMERIFYSGHSYLNNMAKWRALRSLWLQGLLLLSILYIVLFSQFSGDISQFLLRKSAYLPLLVVMSIGFTFSSRNFKINAHLLEQYKHRYIVAKTLNNLMTLDDIQADGVIKTDLLQQGSKTLFEFRTSGYMSKHDPEGTPSQELLAFAKQFNNQKQS